jgi:hypothetical protein
MCEKLNFSAIVLLKNNTKKFTWLFTFTYDHVLFNLKAFILSELPTISKIIRAINK